MYNHGEQLFTKSFAPNFINLEVTESLIASLQLNSLISTQPPDGNLFNFKFIDIPIVWLHIFTRDPAVTYKLYKWIEPSAFRIVETLVPSINLSLTFLQILCWS